MQQGHGGSPRQGGGRAGDGGGGGLLNMLVGHAKDGQWDKVHASSPQSMIMSVREAINESDDEREESDSSDDDDDWDV